MISKRVFVGLLRIIEHRLIPPVEVTPEWQRRGAAISVNGHDIGTTVAKSTRDRDTLRSRDEAGG